MKSKKLLGAISIIAIVAMMLSFVVSKFYTKYNKANSSLEIRRAAAYNQLVDESTDSEFVKFGAYFTEDLNGDGYAEKMLGSCKQVGKTNTMYLDLSVERNGYLEDGVITITNQNFTYAMQVVKDSMLKQNYISDNVRQIEFEKVYAGNNEFLSGVISAAISNSSDYSKTVSVRLTGTHVSDPDPANNNEVTRTPIDTTIELVIDWYGEAEAFVDGGYTKLNLEDYSKEYIERVGEYDETVQRYFTFTVSSLETKRQLLVEKNVITVQFPEVYGYYPTSVTANNGVYDSTNHILTITINGGSYVNDVEVTCLYPQDAYNSLGEGSTISFPVSSYFECYNNPNDPFDNPYITNVSTGTASVYFQLNTAIPSSVGVHCNVNILDKVKINGGYYLSKQNLVDAYAIDDEDEIENMEYTVMWNGQLKTDDHNTHYIVTMKDASSYGDKMEF